MGAFPGDELASRRSLAALLFRLERRREPEALAALIDAVIGWFRSHPGYGELRRLFTELVKWKAEGKAEGWCEGRHEGQGRSLPHLLERRFGPVSDTVRARVDAADIDTLDRWFDRALDASTLETVFDEDVPR